MALAIALADKTMLFGVLTMMGLLRIGFFLMVNKFFKTTNFYGKYIVGLAAGFTIILIATKSQESFWILFMVGINEIYTAFRNEGDEYAQAEVMNLNYFWANVFRIAKWIAIPLAVSVLMYYYNMTQYIYAPLAVFTGLSMIFLYNGYSKTYAKKVTQKIQEDKAYTKKTLMIDALSGLLVTLIYAVAIWMEDNVTLFIIWISSMGMILELVSKRAHKSNTTLFEGVGLVILSIIRYAA